MGQNIKKDDLRTIKTDRALTQAMFILLENRSFLQLTVNDLCNEAMISRATFYAHFTDKYDLLKHWLMHFHPENIHKDDDYGQIEKVVNLFVTQNEKVIKNLVDGANTVTLEILQQYMFSILDISTQASENKKANAKYTVLSTFYGGGMVSYLTWQVKNKFPSDVPMMNIYLYETIEKFLNDDSK